MARGTLWVAPGVFGVCECSWKSKHRRLAPFRSHAAQLVDESFKQHETLGNPVRGAFDQQLTGGYRPGHGLSARQDVTQCKNVQVCSEVCRIIATQLYTDDRKLCEFSL
jgi:hypothetical protein